MKRASGALAALCAFAALVSTLWLSLSRPVLSQSTTLEPTWSYYLPWGASNWHWIPDKVVLILWDGTQRAHLLEMLANGELPYLEGLINETGVLLLPYIDSETCEPGSGDGYRTETCPANSAIATGLGYPGMANWTNVDPHPVPDGLTMWEWFKERGYATGMVCSKDRQYWPHIPLSNAKPDIDWWRVGGTSSWVTNKSMEYVSQRSSSRFFLWVHYSEADSEGHSYGENSVEYSNALARQDQELGTLLTELDRCGLEDETLVVVTTDHGFEEDGFGHSVCDSYTKDLFLVARPEVSWFSECMEAQTDIATCIKGVVLENG